MSVLKKYFNYNCNQDSPIQVDLKRVSKFDEDGEEFISYIPEDYPAIVMANGKANDWSLNALLKAGISPDMPIHTGYSTRLDGVGQLDEISAFVDSILADDESK